MDIDTFKCFFFTLFSGRLSGHAGQAVVLRGCDVMNRLKAPPHCAQLFVAAWGEGGRREVGRALREGGEVGGWLVIQVH